MAATTMGGSELVVLLCQSCGDTFTMHEGDERLCPTCGGSNLELAHEPLL